MIEQVFYKQFIRPATAEQAKEFLWHFLLNRSDIRDSLPSTHPSTHLYSSPASDNDADLVVPTRRGNANIYSTYHRVLWSAKVQLARLPLSSITNAELKSGVEMMVWWWWT